MRIRPAISVLVSLGVASVLVIASAPAASATTWLKTSSTKQNAYSWNGYRTPIVAAGYVIPRGYVKVSATVTVKRGSTTIASNRAAVSVGAGTYTAYSTFKYRSKTAYTAYRSVDVTWIDATSCEVASAAASTNTIDYDLSCTGSGYDADYNDITGVGTTTATQYLYSPDDEPWWTVGQTVSSDDANWYSVSNYFDGTGRQAYTAYRYGIIAAKYFYRTVVVTKVLNTAVMTWTEYNTFGSGDSLARIRAIVGSSGSIYSSSGGLTSYRWKNTTGYYTYVWILDGYWYDDLWLS